MALDRPPTHIDVEEPQFAGVPHLWIQWKGTDLCADVHCACGELSHFDGDFCYFLRCPCCGHVWEVGTHVTLHEPRATPVSVKNAEIT